MLDMNHLILSHSLPWSMCFCGLPMPPIGDRCRPQQSQSPHRRWKDEGRVSGKTQMRDGGERREEWWWETEWEKMNEGGRKQKASGGKGGWQKEMGWEEASAGRLRGREEGRSYECWPLSLYINLHINCIKWGSPCFPILFSLNIP